MPEANPHRRSGTVMIAIAWLLALGGGWWYFDGWVARQNNPNQSLQSDAPGEVVLVRNRYGHYVADGQINGTPVTFMLDTGATDVALPAELANRLGLRRGAAVMMMTANGQALAYQTRLDSVRLGPIVLHDVAASFGDGIGDDTVLMGMSFLKRLEFSQRDGKLILRVPTAR
jgi:aspartyl protease family protein